MASSAAIKRALTEIVQSPFSKSVEWSYPASPPLGFPPPNVAKGEIREVLVWSEDDSEYGTCSVLETTKGEIAYELPGGLLHLAACGEIRLCRILQKEYDNSPFGSYRYRRTTRQVAIKMDKRSTMRQLHDDEDRWDHQHHPFPENPWKEVSALQLIQNNNRDTTPSSQDGNVISLLDALYDDEWLYEMLPYYPKSLYWLIHRENSMGLDETMANHYFVQLIQAVHTIHARGICHRDISSHNLLVDQDKNLVLIDFGMCLRVPYNYPDDHYTEDATEASHLSSRRLMQCQSHCGKLRFMAPEMYAQEEFDGLAVDLWSTAVILFEMITGKLPYQKPCESDPGYHDLLDEHFFWDPKAVSPKFSWGRDVSASLIDLLHGMFRPNPRDRLSLEQIAAHSWVLRQ